jgi:hypothetical protein
MYELYDHKDTMDILSRISYNAEHKIACLKQQIHPASPKIRYEISGRTGFANKILSIVGLS